MTEDTSNEAKEDVRGLPPIGRIKEPEMFHMSTRIRWYAGLGYTVGEIHKRLGVRYQQVRNVLTTTPKRAAREDLPPFIIEVMALDDDFEAMDKHFLEQEMAAQRLGSLSVKRDHARLRKAQDDAEALFGNADLDDENYGR